MARIQLVPGAIVEQVMGTVRETFEARDYHWEQTNTGRALASEGRAPVGDAALPLSQRLRIAVAVDPDERHLVLSQETVGAAFTGAAAAAGAGPWLHLRLSARFRKIVKAVRGDLTAAGWQ